MSARVVVAGIGNVLMGDDGFGVEVVRRLRERELPEDVRLADFGVRGIDLAYALMDAREVVLVDAMARGGPPGTLYVLEPEIDQAPRVADGHALVPHEVLQMVQAATGKLPRVRVVGCEPSPIEDLVMGLSAPVAAAVENACTIVAELCEARDA